MCIYIYVCLYICVCVYAIYIYTGSLFVAGIFSNRRTPWLLVSCCCHIKQCRQLPCHRKVAPEILFAAHLIKRKGTYTNLKIGWGSINQSCPWHHSVIMSSRYGGFHGGSPKSSIFVWGGFFMKININRPSSYGGISDISMELCHQLLGYLHL